MLNSKTGADFDKAYIDNEVAYYEAAIALVEGTLIPFNNFFKSKRLSGKTDNFFLYLFFTLLSKMNKNARDGNS